MRCDSRMRRSPRTIQEPVPARAGRARGLWTGGRSGLGAGLLALSAAAVPAPACMMVEPTAQIAIDFGGGRVSMLRLYVESPEEVAWRMRETEDVRMSQDPAPRCSASIRIPLSAFPTSRLATRPADVARAMHESVKAQGVQRCEVAVYYENDTDEAIPEHELCLIEPFAFGDRDHWSLSRETSCWEPEESELVGTE